MRLARTTLFVAVVCACWPSAGAGAQAVKWVHIGANRDGEISYDPASLARTGDRVLLTVRVALEGDPPTHFIGRVEFDCRQPSLAIHSGQQFGTKGELLRSKTVPTDQVEHDPLVTDSEYTNVYRVVCPDGAPLPKFGSVQTKVIPSNEQPLP